MMWLLVMFDLPSVTSEAKKIYRQFKTSLEKMGFQRIQYSVYARFCPSRDDARKHSRRVEKALPEKGNVRVLKFTDKQWKRMDVFVGGDEKEAKDPPTQTQMF